jgi:hypothetical protein
MVDAIAFMVACRHEICFNQGQFQPSMYDTFWHQRCDLEYIKRSESDPILNEIDSAIMKGGSIDSSNSLVALSENNLDDPLDDVEIVTDALIQNPTNKVKGNYKEILEAATELASASVATGKGLVILGCIMRLIQGVKGDPSSFSKTLE